MTSPKCVAASLSSGGSYAIATLDLETHHVYSVFVGSVQYGTVMVDFNATGVPEEAWPAGPIVAIVILVIVAILAILLILHLAKAPKNYERP